MKRLLAVFLSLFLLLGLTSCGVKGEEVAHRTYSDDRVHIEWKDQGGSSVIPKPDKIFYYHKGKEMALESGTEAFEKVYSMNLARYPETLGGYKTMILDWNDCFKQMDILEYRYDTQYYSVFFNLTVKPGDIQEIYWATSPSRALYGDFSEASDLLAYLNDLK